MIHICQECEKLIKEGERVTVKVTSVYHVLKSSVAFALDKTSLEADTSTLKHEVCPTPEGD